MPVESYYKGHGREVMDSMKKTYGDEDAKRVFYAKAAKDKKPHKKRSKRRGGRR
jgi:hypothetical protein